MKKTSKIIISIFSAVMVAILCVAILVLMIKPKKLSHNISSSEPQLESSTASDNSESELVSSKEETVVSETDKTVSSQSPQKPSTSSTSSSNSGGLSWGPSGDNVVLHPTSGLPLKQPADTETGLSWDGVSPIIYTYPDGTTGTQRIEGAKYEQLPGMWSTVIVFRDDAGREHNSVCSSCGKVVGAGNDKCYYYDHERYCCYCGVLVSRRTCHSCGSDRIKYCEHCGKVAGDGWGGTCLRYWAAGEHECYSCGEIFSANTCHSCFKGCKYCGKTMGNGTNGTCYRKYFNESNCPSCGVFVPDNTCHTCK